MNMTVYFNLVSALRMSACIAPFTRVPLWRVCLSTSVNVLFLCLKSSFFLRLIEGNAVDK